MGRIGEQPMRRSQSFSPDPLRNAALVILEYPVRALRMARQARSEVQAYTWARLREQWAAAYAGVPA